MDFDIKVFFETPPRISNEVRFYIHERATKIVELVCLHTKHLNIDRILPRHVRCIFAVICQDPVTRLERQTITVQQLKVKTMAQLFKIAFDEVEVALEKDSKYGLLDKKIVKGCCAVMEQHGVKASTTGYVFVAAAVSELCGIILHATHVMMVEKTMSLELVHKHGTRVMLSSGQHVYHVSLMRLLKLIHNIDISAPSRTPMHSNRSILKRPKTPIGCKRVRFAVKDSPKVKTRKTSPKL